MGTRRLLALLCLVLLAGPPGPLEARGSVPPEEAEARERAPSRAALQKAAAEPLELVVVLHGLGRTPMSMLPLARALEAEGFDVFNWGYSSFCCTIEELGAQLRDELLEAMREQEAGMDRTVHFVGHSLGNIIIRWLLTHDAEGLRVGRVVMLAPPNQGSLDADRYAPHLSWLLKPLTELRTDSGSTVRTMESVDGVAIGVIAGRYDGKVSLSETQLSEAAEHVVVPGTHTFLMFRSEVHRLTVGFLKDGRFPVPETEPTRVPFR